MRTLARAALLLTAVGLFARAFGFFRDVLVAARFGSGVETDALFLVQALWLQLQAFVVGAIPAVLVPKLARAAAEGGDDVAESLIGSLLVVLCGMATALTVVVGLWPDLWMARFAPELSPEARALSVQLLVWILHALPLGVAAGVLQAVAQQRGAFGWGEAAALWVNGGAMLGIVLLADPMGVISVHAGIAVGAVIQVLWMVHWCARQGFRPRLRWSTTRVALGLSVGVLLSVLLSWSGGYISMLVDRAYSARLAPGELSDQAYAMRVAGLVSQVFGAPLTTILLSAMSGAAAAGAGAGFDRLATRGFRVTLFVVTPLLLLAAAVPDPIVTLLFVRDAFGSDDAADASVLLRWVAPSTALDMLRGALATALFAAGRPGLAFALGAARVALSLALYPMALERGGVEGLCAGLCVINVLLLGLAGAAVRFGIGVRWPGLAGDLVRWALCVVPALSASRLGVAAVPMISTASTVQSFVQCAVAGLSFGIVFVGLGWRFGPPEVAELVRALGRKVGARVR